MEFLDKINDWGQEHPENGYLIVAGLLAFWLFCVIMGWKWAYRGHSAKSNWLRELLGETMYRICVGVLLTIALACTLYLYFVVGK